MPTQFPKNELKNDFGLNNLLSDLICCYINDAQRFVASVFELNFVIGLLQWSWIIWSAREKLKLNANGWCLQQVPELRQPVFDTCFYLDAGLAEHIYDWVCLIFFRRHLPHASFRMIGVPYNFSSTLVGKTTQL
jgi:hypothetical protein